MSDKQELVFNSSLITYHGFSHFTVTVTSFVPQDDLKVTTKLPVFLLIEVMV